MSSSNNEKNIIEQNPIWFPMGDHGLILDFTGFKPLSDDIAFAPTAELAAKILHISEMIRMANISAISEIVPSMTRLFIAFDPLQQDASQIKQLILPLLNSTGEQTTSTGTHWRLPVCYEGDCAPDLSEVAERVDLSEEEVIKRHLANTLTVSVMGFLPGNGYMAGVDERLTLPRRDNPRVAVPARSVGIAIGQCVIYPMDSPGGWHLIGRTPFPTFDPKRYNPILFSAGDKVSFERISLETLAQQEEEYQNGLLTENDLKVTE